MPDISFQVPGGLFPQSPDYSKFGNYAAMLQQGFGDLGNAYWEGLQRAQQLKQQNLFANGLPTGSNGQPDPAAIAAQSIRAQGAQSNPAMTSFLFGQQVMNGSGGGKPTSGAIQSSPLPPPSQSNEQRVPQGGVTRLADEQLPGSDTWNDPAAGLLPPGYRGDSRAFAARLRESGESELERIGRLKMAGIDVGPQQAAAQSKIDKAKEIEAAWAKDSEKTTREKDYRTGKKPGETMPEYEARVAGAVTGATNEATETGKMLTKYTEEGLDAIGHKAMLNTVKELGEKVPYGIIPKIQSELGKFGIETKGLSDIQAYERAVDYMAPQLRPIGSGRLMQQELTAFKSSLGGLMTTPEGRRVSVENLKLLSEYKEKIGRIAADTSIPERERMEAIYKTPPPHLLTLEDVKGQGTDWLPPVNGAQKAQDGQWYINDPNRPGKFLRVKKDQDRVQAPSPPPPGLGR